MANANPSWLPRLEVEDNTHNHTLHLVAPRCAWINICSFSFFIRKKMQAEFIPLLPHSRGPQGPLSCGQLKILGALDMCNALLSLCLWHRLSALALYPSLLLFGFQKLLSSVRPHAPKPYPCGLEDKRKQENWLCLTLQKPVPCH